MKKDLLAILDLTKEDILAILNRAGELKADLRAGRCHLTLKGKTMAMIFKKPSTRTRVSFQTGMFQMGGLALDLNMDSLQIGRGEPLPDTARVFSRYVDIILIRTFAQEEAEALARFAGIPVINGLTDLFHPCQVLSDLFTIKEHLKKIGGVKIAYVGDGNNVAHSWINAAGVMDLDLRLACPEGFEPDKGILDRAIDLAIKSGGRIKTFKDPKDAAFGADIIYTDVWVSMGQEEGVEGKKRFFQGFQVNSGLLEKADPHVKVMHCLPAHRGEEITEEVLDGPHSIVFDQAENRLHVQKAIIEAFINKNEGKKGCQRD
ncbi:ornithine carbamoyltransferase [bacterium]|nr:ornithine carbamoyltransferase [bacterium]